ncbi:calcium sensing receptor chloroplastic [Prunus yedoensis var. nudiflora]|uniref:Calcium sensing receptor chloroplastic n=1 Tax=Prunus yedoensis var. nudiflora TaxID=2094558 RepID=A0A314UJA5_PRUYE|nr:calcium sensing receptor chloroplastic [Prunus yedoensis var. nudiflora]
MAVEMAIRASATPRPSLPPPSPSLSATTKCSLKPKFRPTSVSLPTSTTISLLALFTSPFEAQAFSLSKDQIVSSLTEVEQTIDQVQQAGSTVFEGTERVLEAILNAVKPGIDVALPIAKQAGEQALKIASPTISEVSKKAQEALQSSGFDTQPVLGAAKTLADAAGQTTKVIEEAKPIASSSIQTISSADPIVIAGTAGALYLTYLLLPPIWSALSFSLRGYKGSLTPAQTLDLISTKNYLLIDIRPEKDKDKAGIPRLPSSAKSKMIAIPLEELPSKLRGLVRNVKKVEAEITALKISYLKRVNKGSNIVILDSYSDSGKIVARALTSLGFKKCWTVADGFSGSKGWLQSRLGADSYNLSFAEVLSPSRVIPAAVRRFGTSSSTASQSGRKLLPGSD